MDEEIANKVLQKADIALKDNDRIIAGLPSYQVYYCKGLDKVGELINKMNGFIDSLYPLMAGTEEETRVMMLEYIKIAENEIEVAKGFLDMFKK